MYNKEIKVNQDEIPIILAELTDAAFNFIQRENYEKALILLQKTEGVLEVGPICWLADGMSNCCDFSLRRLLVWTGAHGTSTSPSSHTTTCQCAIRSKSLLAR